MGLLAVAENRTVGRYRYFQLPFKVGTPSRSKVEMIFRLDFVDLTLGNLLGLGNVPKSASVRR
jgi:hypothetical protein